MKVCGTIHKSTDTTLDTCMELFPCVNLVSLKSEILHILWCCLKYEHMNIIIVH